MNRDISVMIDSLLQQMRELGLTPNTLKVYEHSAFKPILFYYNQRGCQLYNQQLTDELMQIYSAQLESGNLKRPLFLIRKRGILLLQDFQKDYVFHYARFFNYDHREIPDAFSDIMQSFEKSLTLSEGSVKRACGIVRTFLIYLDNHDIHDLNSIQPADAESFIKEMRGITPNSMDSVIYSLRKFFSYIETLGIDIKKTRLLLSSPLRIKKIQPTFSEKELSDIFFAIDTSSPPGKRDFAIISLAATTGIRGGDLIRLQLEDIKWKDAEIHIIQEKTGRFISVPIQKSVASAVADYILNERPKTESKEVFLTSRAPYRPFDHSSDLSGVLQKYVSLAGIQRVKGDGKTFHGLRRFVGTNVVRNGSTATMAAEVLGHRGIAATKQYISVDMEGLKRCILPMSSLRGGAG